MILLFNSLPTLQGFKEFVHKLLVCRSHARVQLCDGLAREDGRITFEDRRSLPLIWQSPVSATFGMCSNIL